jgi:hypothetical protein
LKSLILGFGWIFKRRLGMNKDGKINRMRRKASERIYIWLWRLKAELLVRFCGWQWID